jgi:hypothetical protein
MRCLSVNMLLQKKQKNIAGAHYQSLFKVSVGSSSQADYLMRNAAMDDSIGGSLGVTSLRVQCTARPYESELLDFRPTLAR